MNRRERVLLMLAIVILGGIVFKFMIHDPQQSQYDGLVAARDASQAELDRDERIVARAAQARAEYERVRTYIASVEEKLPQRKDIPALLTAMEQFTHRVGVTFESIHPSMLQAVVTAPAAQGSQPGKPNPAPSGHPGGASADQGKPVPYSSMQVDLSLRGTFAQAVKYLRELRNFPRLVIVDSVSMSPSGFPNLGITIKTEIFTLGTPDQAAEGPATPTVPAPSAAPSAPAQAPAPSGPAPAHAPQGGH
jgi:Tfp pilus assembly protein PilO